MKKLNIIAVLIIAMALFSCKTNETMVDNNTVGNLELNRYLGTWYEIARFPHSFERGLVGVTATYTMNENGTINVVNQGFKGSLDGEISRAEGKAKVPDPDNPARLRVSFFWIFYSDYLVMELDKDYRWAVVGSSSPKYLWILSRDPVMSDTVLNEIKSRIEKRGYNISNLQMVKQKSG